MYLILSPKVEPADLRSGNDTLEDLPVDFTDLLQFTLQHWPLLDGGILSMEELRAAAEAHLSQPYFITKLHDYRHMQEVVDAVVNAVQVFYDSLSGQLTPLIEPFGLDVTVRLTRYMHKDLVIRVEKPYHGP